jgi:tetraacyldisaccharide 4'-kinase
LAVSGDYFRALVSGQARGVGPSLARGVLHLASWPYGGATRVRNWLYDRSWKASYRVAVPVVSIGNLTLGGTGKTPCVEYVARLYRRLERRVAILSRGYGNERGRNDEALVLEENLADVPHLQGADRAALAQVAVAELESEVLVLDDAFQHRRLQRDLDVVLIDATEPWGHGYLFPRGLLREGRAGLGRAGAVVLTRCDQATEPALAELRKEVGRLAPGATLAETSHQPRELWNTEQAVAPLTELPGQQMAAFCGIGNPGAFRRTLSGLGVEANEFRTYPDHYGYTLADVQELRAWASRQAKDCLIITTQKDLVKLRLTQLGGRPLWALRIGLAFRAGQEALDRKLTEVLQGDR